MDSGARSDSSVSQWILGAKQGNCHAVQALWQRYFRELVGLAREKLAGVPRRAADEEDVALSAFASFCDAARRGRFPDLADRHSLWRLLITFTAQKAIDWARHEKRQKRGGGKVQGESALAGRDSPDHRQALAQCVGDTPSPDFAAIAADECSRLLNCLTDNLRRVAVAKMENYSNQEVAEQLHCSVRTVERSLQLIRKIWQRQTDASD